jgi:hypothetical protein
VRTADFAAVGAFVVLATLGAEAAARAAAVVRVEYDGWWVTVRTPLRRAVSFDTRSVCAVRTRARSGA